jgi:hypothetical protein
MTPFPGASIGWKSKHLACGKVVAPRYGYVKRGGSGCIYCSGLAPISKSAARKLFLSRGFRPLEPYVNSKTPVRSIHKVCGREVSPLYGSIKDGGGCKFCSIGGINLLKPGFLYLITNESLNAHKIGIGGSEASNNRIREHEKFGWIVYQILDFEKAETAYEIEQEVLSWLRNDLGLGHHLLPEQMPQGGYTETVDSYEIDLPTIWEKVVDFKSNVSQQV